MEENPFFYLTNAGAITIYGWSQQAYSQSFFDINLAIPSTINGLPVTGIGDDAFLQTVSLTSVTIPGSVTSIGASAFSSCSGLINVSIANGVASIGPYAFAGTALPGVTIPASVTKIGPGAFESCARLTAITVDAQNAFYRSVDGVLFDKIQSSLVEYPYGIPGSYTIPQSVTSIGAEAFGGCAQLTGITIPGRVNSIGNSAFADCASLTSVTIPGSVTNIADNAFASDSRLADVFFKGNAPTANASVFGCGCGDHDTAATVYYLPGATGWSNTFCGLPAVLWNPLIQTGDGNFGVRNGQFGFNITGTANIPIVVEGCANAAGPVWVPLQSLTLTNGLFHFSEPVEANSPGRYYRIGSP